MSQKISNHRQSARKAPRPSELKKEQTVDKEQSTQKLSEKTEQIDQNQNHEVEIQKEEQAIQEDHKEQNQQQQRENEQISKEEDKSEVSNEKEETVANGNTKIHMKYLKIIFQHYCKVSYALRKDPTFEEIEKKSSRLQMNKWMIFSKDFKLKKCLKLSELTDLFKRNAEYSKYMTFQQFIETLHLISSMISPQDSWLNLMKLFQIQNFYAFKDRMVKLNIGFRMKNNSEKKKNSYKFKHTPYNGKNEEQITVEVEELRKLRRQRKEEMMKKHKENKINKIQELYKNGMSKIVQIASSNSKTQTRNRYNKCPLLTYQLQNHKTYRQIFEAKETKQKYDKFGKNINGKKLTLDKAKVNSVISEARQKMNQIRQEEKRSLEKVLEDEIDVLSKSVYRNTRTVLPMSESSNIMNRNQEEEELDILDEEEDSLLEMQLANQRQYYGKCQQNIN